MWLPVGYDTPVNEYWNTVERAGLWDVGVERIVEISGPDAVAFTNLLTPRDIEKVKVGQCRYVFLTNQDGGILLELVRYTAARGRGGCEGETARVQVASRHAGVVTLAEWLRTVGRYRQRGRRAFGSVAALREFAERIGQSWLKGVGAAPA